MVGSPRPSEGIVYVVGAGPGDPGLLTRRGAELLSRADVVVRDRLVHPALIELAPGARVVDVGRHPGERKPSQEEISELLVSEARAGRVVVRLKGGDPFVFGRGGEECEALRDAGVRFEVVPGVTSATAGLTYAGIPLTHRGYASWVVLATGHEDPGKGDSALDWDALARAPVAVFLMGVRRMPEIARALREAGRDPATPAAAVSWASWPEQRVVRSTLAEVAEASREGGVAPPALLVVGEVAGLGERLDWYGARPLAGRRIFVTRPRHQAGELAEALRELGAEPLVFPAIRIVDADPGPLDAALGRLAGGEYAWTIVTSRNTVDVLWERLRATGRDARAFGGTAVAAIGPATAEGLARVGVVPDLVPDTFTTQAVADAVPEAAGDGDRLLLPRAAEAPPDLQHLLEGRGWTVDVVPAYRTLPDEDSREGGRAALEAGVDAVCFTAGSTVRAFVDLWGRPPSDPLVCCIGPVTADVAREAGLRVDVEASEHTIPGLVDALVEALGSG